MEVLLVMGGFFAVFAFLVWWVAHHAKQSHAKQEAYFTSMFPDLQPYYHPKNVLEFVRARLAQAPASGGMTMKSPPGFTAPAARVSFETDKKGRERELWVLLDEAGRELTRFFFESDAKDGMVRIGEGKFRVARAGADYVRYWHPDREFKWTPQLWRFVTRVSEQPIDSDRSGMSFGDSSSSRTAATAAAATGIAAAGGTFDGGGASAAWDGKAGAGSDSSDSDTSTAGATSY